MKESGFMKMKRVATGLCALIMVFGGAVCPAAPIVSSVAVTASAATYGDYEYIVFGDNTVEITAYNGGASNLSVPSSIGGKTVVSIGEEAFDGNHSIMSVTLPSTIKSIGTCAFFNCGNL